MLYSSKPTFVYFFNPKLDVVTQIEKDGDGTKVIDIGFRNNEGVRIKINQNTN